MMIETVRRWLGWPGHDSVLRPPTPRRLSRPLGRTDFLRLRSRCAELLQDLPPDEQGIAWRIQRCRDLTELWYLRPSIFAEVARHRSQAEAQQRLNQIDQILPWPH